jgi:hypothetical protein
MWTVLSRSVGASVGPATNAPSVLIARSRGVVQPYKLAKHFRNAHLVGARDVTGSLAQRGCEDVRRRHSGRQIARVARRSTLGIYRRFGRVTKPRSDHVGPRISDYTLFLLGSAKRL